MSVRRLYQHLMMNVWNCKRALKPSFKSDVSELVANHNPAILVVMETLLGGDRAKEITENLPFQGANSYRHHCLCWRSLVALELRQSGDNQSHLHGARNPCSCEGKVL